MNIDQFNRTPNADAEILTTFTTSDLEQLTRLMAELKELTQSRATYAAATEFLKRFGGDDDGDALVRPERLAN